MPQTVLSVEHGNMPLRDILNCSTQQCFLPDNLRITQILRDWEQWAKIILAYFLSRV